MLASYFANKLSMSPDFNRGLSAVPPESDVTYNNTWGSKFLDL